MTSYSSLFSIKSLLSNAPTIIIADGSTMNVSHIGSILTSNLSVSQTFLVPKLSLDLPSVGQLCDLGLDLYFSRIGCVI